jgi:hypothetical protein
MVLQGDGQTPDNGTLIEDSFVAGADNYRDRFTHRR